MDTLSRSGTLKTGNAELTGQRRQEIRDEVGVFSDVPVIELHICRGVTCKAQSGSQV